MNYKNKIFSTTYVKDLEKLVNEWLETSEVEIHSQQLSFNNEMSKHVLSILYKDKNDKSISLNS